LLSFVIVITYTSTINITAKFFNIKNYSVDAALITVNALVNVYSLLYTYILCFVFVYKTNKMTDYDFVKRGKLKLKGSKHK